MNITFRTASTLRRFLPPGARNDTARIEVAEGATPLDVMKQLGLPLRESYLVTLNGAALPKAARGTRRLAENDDLAVMPPLRGG
ncbi:MAG: MoaD/ThiS family protein [Alphaproteobacteria bacterium]